MRREDENYKCDCCDQWRPENHPENNQRWGFQKNFIVFKLFVNSNGRWMIKL